MPSSRLRRWSPRAAARRPRPPARRRRRPRRPPPRRRPRPRRRADVRLYAFHCGGERTLRSLFDPMDPACGEVMEVPYFFLLVQHAGHNVLFDTGMHPDAIDDRPRHFGDDADLYDLAPAPGDDAVSLLAPVG